MKSQNPVVRLGEDSSFHICELDEYSRVHLLGSVGDPLADVQERGDPRTNEEGGWMKIYDA